MARFGLLLAGTAAILAAAAPTAVAGQFASEGFGLAGTPGGNLLSHANQFLRDGGGLGRKTVIAKAKGATAAGRRTTLRGKLARRARRAMRRRNSLRLSLAATFTDAAGNQAQQTRKGALKRPRRR